MAGGMWSLHWARHLSWLIHTLTGAVGCLEAHLCCLPEQLLCQSLCGDHNKLGKILKEMGVPDRLTCLLTICVQIRKQQLELDMEQQISSKLGKEYIKAVYCQPAYLTYMQSTSWETLGWVKHNLESRLLGEISITSDMYMTPPNVRKERKEELKRLLLKVRGKNEKAGLKLNIQKTNIMASCPITLWQLDGGKVDRFSFWGLQNHCRWGLQPWN